MNLRIAKKLLIVGAIIFALIAVLFGILSIINIQNYLYRILLQGFLAMELLFLGLTINSNANTKAGYIPIIVAAFVFCAMLYTLYVGIDINAL